MMRYFAYVLENDHLAFVGQGNCLYVLMNALDNKSNVPICVIDTKTANAWYIKDGKVNGPSMSPEN